MHSEPQKIQTQLDYSKEEILEELNRVLSSDFFSHSSVLSSFLKFIVEETLEDNTAGLKEYTIGVGALGKPADFNPQTDAIVRIHAGRLRRLLKEYYTGPGFTDPIRIEVIKGTYVPTFRRQIAERQNGKADEKINTPQYSRSKLTLAVLPFRNLCPDQEYQFFVDGFGEELTRIFSTCQDIAVIAHYSARKYCSVSDDIRVIGKELGIHFVITGTVMRSSSNIRINIGLTETLNGIQIWSKKYQHALKTDAFMEIQDQISDDVFAILAGHFGFIIRNKMHGLHGRKKVDLASYDVIMWIYYAKMTHSLEALTNTRKALEKAIQQDPDNVTSLTLLANLYLDSYTLGFPNVEDPINEAYQLLNRALALDPLSQYTHMIYAWVNIYMHKKKEAIEAINYSMQLGSSSASVDGTLGFGLACLGEYKRGFPLLKQSLDLNPYCPWWYHMGFFFVYYHDKKYNEALASAQKMDASDDVFLRPLLKTAAMGQLGLLAEAQAEINILKQQFQQILPNLKTHLCTFLLDDALAGHIMEGAKKAGLAVP